MNQFSYSKKIIFLIWFGALLIINFNTFWDPPYWDAIMGIYTQGVWLFHHGFDYSLLLKQPGYHLGGPNISLFCLFAPFFALLLKIFPVSLIFFFFHILVNAMAAFSLLLAQLFFQEKSRFSGWIWCLLILFFPIWNAQTASIYLEISIAFFCILSFYQFYKKRMGLAALFCFLGVFTKEISLIQALAYIVYFFYAGTLTFFLKKNSIFRFLKINFLLTLPVLGIYILKNFQTNNVYCCSSFSLSKFIQSIRSLQNLAPTLLILIILYILCIFLFLKNMQILKEKKSLCELLIIYISGFWVAYFYYDHSLIRYPVVVIIPMVLFIHLVITNYGKLSFLIYPLIILCFLNTYGFGLQKLQKSTSRSGSQLERSREYLIDLKANQRLFSYIEKNHYDDPIIAKYPYVQMLTLPEMGYVTRPMKEVYSSGLHPLITPAKPLSLPYNETKQPLFLYSPTVFENKNNGLFMHPYKEDKILYYDVSLDGAVILYEAQ